MKNSSALRNARRLSVAAVLAGGCLAGNAVAQQQMRRVTEAAPAAPAPASTVARVAPVAPAFPPGPPTQPASVARVAPVTPPAAAPPPAANARMASTPATMNHGGLAPNRTYVPFPTGMTNTTDSKVCTQHGNFAAGLGCTAGLPHGMLALVWNCPNCKVDGYRLFRVDSGKHDPVAIPANGADFTAALLDAPPGGFNGQCYAVVAYRAAYESAPSNAYCASGGSVINMVTDTFQPDHVRSSTAMMSTGALMASFTTADDLEVGAMHAAVKGGALASDSYTNRISRSGVHFDLGRLSQRHIFSARLHVTVDTSTLDNQAIDHGTSCASAIAVGSDLWWQHTDWILLPGQHDAINSFATPSRLQPGSVDGPDATYDVTPIVADWAQGTQNLGLVLLTEDAGIHGFSNNGCRTTYARNISLEVKSWN